MNTIVWYFQEFFLSVKDMARSLSQGTTVESFQKWGDEEKALNDKFLSTKDAVHTALCGKFFIRNSDEKNIRGLEISSLLISLGCDSKSPGWICRSDCKSFIAHRSALFFLPEHHQIIEAVRTVILQVESNRQIDR